MLLEDTMKNPLISIIILNWNGKEVLKECLDSVKAQTFKDHETIVVDNASTEGSQEFLKKNYSWAKLVQNKENLGYAGGNNGGIRKAKGDWILILNNDTVLDKNFLKELNTCKDKADIFGVKNYFYDKKETIWSVGSKVNKLTMRASLIGNKEKDQGQYDDTKIEHAVGSAILAKKEVFNKIGYFDESYFAYYEETEWQTRAIVAGFKIALCPKAKLWHKVAYSTGGGRSPLSSYYLLRNRGYFIRKWSKHKFLAYLVWVAEAKLRIFYGLLKNRKFAKMSWKGTVDFLKGKKGKL
jgi:GT2 family glycosyltransferase